MIDKGLNLRDVEGLLDTAGDYVDIVKLGWGTGYVTHNLEKKIDALPLLRDAGRLRRHVLRGRLRARPHRRVQDAGCGSSASRTSRSPTASIDIPRERKLELIEDFARDFTVLSEVGSKDPDVVFAPDQWVQWIEEELDAGAGKVITEAREGGTAGIFRKDGDMRTGPARGDRARDRRSSDLIFEAPTKSSQAWFVKNFGPNVNLGNIPPDEVIPLETLRLGLRGDTLKEVLLGDGRACSYLTSRRCTAEDVLRWAYEEFGDKLCLTCSWQKQSSVLVHMVSASSGSTSRSSSSTRSSSSARRTRRATRSSSATASTLDHAARDHRRRAAQAGRPEPLGARPRPLLPHPQGRAAVRGA